MATTTTTQPPSRCEWLTVREACALVGVSPATLRRWSDNGHVRAFTTPGGHRRFARSAILSLLPDDDGPRVEAPAANGSTGVGESSPAVFALTAHARRVPSEAREAFAAKLDAREPERAEIVVHTCHRVELYVARDDGERPALPDSPPGTRRLEGMDAVRHVVGVACGLDSAVLGENQVLHQLRETLKRRREDRRSLDPALDRLFQASLNAGRRARSWLNGTQRSLADVALERIAQRTGPLEGRRLLVVGSGVMGRLAARAAVHRGALVTVTSRTEARAAALAQEVGADTAPFGADDALPAADGVLVALSGHWQVGPADAGRLAAGGATVVDLSSPAAVGEDLRALLGDRFLSTDALAGESEFAPQGKLRRRLEDLVEESSDAYRRWLRGRSALPAIKAIGEAADERRQDELQWLFHRLPDLPKRERALIEQMSHRLVADILHAPRTALNTDESGELARAARDLFGT